MITPQEFISRVSEEDETLDPHTESGPCIQQMGGKVKITPHYFQFEMPGDRPTTCRGYNRGTGRLYLIRMLKHCFKRIGKL